MSATEVPGVGAVAGGVEAVWPGGLRAAVTLGDVLAEGGDARIHAVAGRADVVAKVYRVPGAERRAKLDAMLAAPPEGRASTFDGRTYVQFAWPVARLEGGPLPGTPPGTPAAELGADAPTTGFLMPRVDLEDAALLEMLLTGRARQASRLPEGLRARVTAAHNLAAAVAGLHAAGHYVVDLKPANVHVYRETQFVAVLDCDGFSVAGPEGVRFPAHQYTEGYIAPESTAQRPEELGEAQDRFALAVVIFQLLNRGLHPFQGVPMPGARVPTTDAERVAASLYPYGPDAADVLRPPPQSRYAYFDARTRAHFDAAFDAPAERRPSAALWRDSLRALLDGRLHRCPNDPDHARFGDEPCGACALDDERAQQAALAAMERVAAPAPEPPASTASQGGGGMGRSILWGAGLSLFALLWIGLFTGPARWDDTDIAPVVPMEAGSMEENADAFSQLLDAVTEGDVVAAREAVASGAAFGDTESVVGLRDIGDGEHAYRPVREPDATIRTSCQPPESSAGMVGISALSLAAELGNVSMVQALMELSAPPGGFDRALGRTALMSVARQCTLVASPDAPIIGGLLDVAATGPVFERVSGEWTARVDSMNGNAAVRDFIRQPGESELGFMDLVANIAVMKALLARGAPVDARDAWGRTALVYAAGAGNAAAVRLLLQAGANPDARDANDISPLIAAADVAISPATDVASAAVVYELLMAGADAALATGTGKRAADYVGERPATTAARLGARPDSAAVATVDLLGLSRTRAMLASSARGAALLAVPPVRVDRARSADLGDGSTAVSPSVSRRPVPTDARSMPTEVEVRCQGFAHQRVLARVTYVRRGDGTWGEVRRVSVEGWVQRPLGPGATEREATERDDQLRCLREIVGAVSGLVRIVGEPERWPVVETGVVVWGQVRPPAPSYVPPPPALPPPPPPR